MSVHVGRLDASGNSRVHIGNTSYQAEDRCLADLRPSDPRHDKIRIEEAKGGLLKDSYRWILDNDDFRQWRDHDHSRLLWIKGDPGKGKTMLLCGIIDELKPSTKLADKDSGKLLSYFFCQATDSRINNATAVLRGLMYLLIDQQPSLISHLRKAYDHSGKQLFEDANAWVALSEMFKIMLADSQLGDTTLIVDALDECDTGLPKLLDFIAQNSGSPGVRWLVSSRNKPEIESKLRADLSRARLSLELKQNADCVSHAVDVYIEHSVLELPSTQGDEVVQARVRDAMRRKANGTFLWVSLVVKELEDAERWEVEGIVDKMPTSLKEIYHRMFGQIQRRERRNPEHCQRLLSTAATAYRPLSLDELGVLSDLPEDISRDPKSVESIARLCGSFLTIQDGVVYIIHQTAKDFLSTDMRLGIAHQTIFSRSLKVMFRTLRPDMYGLVAPGSSIDAVQRPDIDPLAAARYSCVSWVYHLVHSPAQGNHTDVYAFLSRCCLYWIEALSLLRSISDGVLSLAKLEEFCREGETELVDLVRDTRRFIQHFKYAIEDAPLQVYASGLVFSPARSIVRGLFARDEPKWIGLKPVVEADWSACLWTLEGHAGRVDAVAFSPDGSLLASASADSTIKTWNPKTGACQSTFRSCRLIQWVAFSPDGSLIASATGEVDPGVMVWDAATGECQLTLRGNCESLESVIFSPDGLLLASASKDGTVRLWDLMGTCQATLLHHVSMFAIRHDDCPCSVYFSADSALLASVSRSGTVKVWDANHTCQSTFQHHGPTRAELTVLSASLQLCVFVAGGNLEIWNTATRTRLSTLEHCRPRSAVFSPSDQLLALGNLDGIITIWDIVSGTSLATFVGHRGSITSMAFSPDNSLLASASDDETVKIWDATSSQSTLENQSAYVTSIIFSSTGPLLLTVTANNHNDYTIKIWDPTTGNCQSTQDHLFDFPIIKLSPDGSMLAWSLRKGTMEIWNTATETRRSVFKLDGSRITSVAFSPDGKLLALASWDMTVKIWDVASGTCRAILTGLKGCDVSVAFSSDGTLLATVTFRTSLMVWDLQTGEFLSELHSGRFGFEAAVFLSSPLLASVADRGAIEIWDTSTGRCLQVIETGKNIELLSFDPATSCLYTNFGAIRLDLSCLDSGMAVTTLDRTPSDPARRVGYGISFDRAWIMWNSQRILWLPTEYRPWKSAIEGSTVVLGCQSGRVLILRFSEGGPGS